MSSVINRIVGGAQLLIILSIRTPSQRNTVLVGGTVAIVCTPPDNG